MDGDHRPSMFTQARGEVILFPSIYLVTQLLTGTGIVGTVYLMRRWRGRGDHAETEGATQDATEEEMQNLKN